VEPEPWQSKKSSKRRGAAGQIKKYRLPMVMKMRQKTNEKALETIRLLEKDGRKVYKVKFDGQKFELVLSADDCSEPKASW
jgi:hypothetical protein